MADSKVKLVCNECGRKWKVSPDAVDPRCSRCGSVDWDVYDAAEQPRTYAE